MAETPMGRRAAWRGHRLRRLARGVDVGEGRDLKFLVTSTPGQLAVNRSGGASSPSRFVAIRFTHLENRLKDKDLDDSRSAEDRYVLVSMFVEEIRLFALRKE